MNQILKKKRCHNAILHIFIDIAHTCTFNGCLLGRLNTTLRNRLVAAFASLLKKKIHRIPF